ncbi:MAG TPA: DUF72 domain-containing protein [Candidatus Saccharimonadia bacterium]
MIWVGTSGWSYKDWGKGFYPPGLPAREQLPYLAGHFSTVELNASFYRLPARKVFEHWRVVTPEGFVFAMKASRFITHIKRLDDVAEAWRLLRERAAGLGGKLGVVLLQFPPSFRADEVALARLESFAGLVSGGDGPVRTAYEWRHKTWFEPAALAALERLGLCVVQADSARFPHTPQGFVPARFTYYRFHGPRQLYASQYRDDELDAWARQMQSDAALGKDIYAYFDNDVHGYALEDARRLRERLA